MATDDKRMPLTNEQSAKKTPIGVGVRYMPETKRQGDHVRLEIGEGSSSQQTEAPAYLDVGDSYISAIQTKSLDDHVNLGIGKGSGSQQTQAYCMIERVPEILRQDEANKNCFTPLLVALGPYHCMTKVNQKRGLQLKIQLVSKFLSYDKSSYLAYFKWAQKVLIEARWFYSKDLIANMRDSTFANGMFVDGCALLQFISSVLKEDWGGLNIKYYERLLFVNDLFLLENQVPFAVLQELMPENEVKSMFDKFIKKIRPSREVKASSWPRIADFFYDCRRKDKNRKQKTDPEGEVCYREDRSSQNEDHGQPLHLLDMLWKHYAPLVHEPPKNRDSNEDWYTFRSAKELKAAGIMFSHSKTCNFTDVKYEPLPLLPISYLCLPPIVVDDLAKSSLLNLAAYEMSSSHPNSYPVCSYLFLMDSLIDDAEDVGELRRSGVILNCLGSDEQVASLFNDVAKHLVSDPNAYRRVKLQIEEHYNNQIKIWITEGLYTHFSTPWTFLAFIAAILALGMTVIQTIKALQD